MTTAPRTTQTRRERSLKSAAHLDWPQALALTLLVLFAVIIAAGWFNLALPWIGA
jgi:hypothetical protein